MKLVWVGFVAMLLTSCAAENAAGRPASASRSCSSQADTEEISQVIRAFFAALAIDDSAALTRLTTSDFYAFEVGKRYSGPELATLIADGHRSGRIWEWNIGPIDVRADCNQAFAAWNNTGAAGTAGNMQPRAWLESALLLRNGSQWVIHFLHSTPKDPRS